MLNIPPPCQSVQDRKVNDAEGKAGVNINPVYSIREEHYSHVRLRGRDQETWDCTVELE